MSILTFSDVLTKKDGVRTPITFDMNDVMRGGGGGGGGGCNETSK